MISHEEIPQLEETPQNPEKHGQNELETNELDQKEYVFAEQEKPLRRFEKEIEKDPSPENTLRKMKDCFNQTEGAVKRMFDEVVLNAGKYERVNDIQNLAYRSSLGCTALKDELISKIPEGISVREREDLIEEMEETSVYYKGRALLSFVSQREEIDKKKHSDPATRNTERAALQQTLAQYYLEHADIMEKVNPRLDVYAVGSVFNSMDDYGAFRYGVINLANACLHLESQGFETFFPPAKLDAKQQIDLVGVKKSAMEEYGDEIRELLRRGYSTKDLSELDPELAASICVVQVKSRGNLERTYSKVEDANGELPKILKSMSLDKSDFDGVNNTIMSETVIQMNELEGVTKNKSRAAVCICPPVEKQGYSSDGYSSSSMSGNFRSPVDKFKKDTREMMAFMGQVLNVASAYIYVEEMDKPQQQAKSSFYA
ncbi:MAG: hypothetical protein KAR24_03265 [Candidatus Pacebacteria bacterium]|nr:hypothetical protein [Candidatus Paceibacterota bacterium]